MFKKNIKPILLAGALALATAVSPVLADELESPTEDQVSGIQVSKTLTYAKGVNSFSTGTFYFNISFEGAVNPITGLPIDGATLNVTPTIKDNDPEFSYQFAPKTTSENSIINDTIATESISFTANTNTVPGIYKYSISEVNTADPNVTYSDATYTILVDVHYDEENLVIAQFAYLGDVDYGTNEDKLPKITFTNSYTEDKSNALKVTKTVTGNYGDKQEYFEFTGTITIPTTAKNSYTINANTDNDITNGNETVTLQKGDNPITFYLKSEDELDFGTLPVGTTYSFKETKAGQDGYTTTITGADSLNGTQLIINNSSTNKEVTGTVTDADSNTDEVTFKNAKSGNPITGVIVNNMPYIALLGASGAGLVVLAASKKRSKK